MNAKTVFAFVGVFFFCCTNAYLLEVLVRIDPGLGNVITFSQFVLFSIHGIIFTSNFGRVKRQIPMSRYVTLVLLFFFSSVLNNYAFNFNIPMPLHMIFRSGSLMANMILGVFILEKKYTITKYASVVMITIGIIVCTIQTGAHVKSISKGKLLKNNETISEALTEVNDKKKESQSFKEMLTGSEDFIWWLVGVIILTLALFLAARMGIFQETLYVKYGKHPWEALFYTHVLPMPLFLFISPNLWNHWVLSGQGEPFLYFEYVSSTRMYLLINSITQCCCVGCVYVLTSECTSLTVTLTVTLRKFASLIFSILYFKNPFTFAHWAGTLLIFIGTCMFTELVQNTYKAIFPPKTIPITNADEEGLLAQVDEKGDVK